MNKFQKYIDEYINWLKDKTILRQIDEWTEISTPYLDRNNDYLEIYAKEENGRIILTDDGYVISDLKLSGCDLESEKRSALLQLSLNGFGVTNKNGVLEIIATPENFAQKKHNLIQSMLAISDMFYLAEPYITNIFYEDVVKWLDINKIRYTEKIQFTGKSGYTHSYDFIIPKTEKYPERILQTINKPSKDNAQSLAFSWIDTRDMRPKNSNLIAILNDSDHKVPYEIINALESYEIKPLLWGARENSLLPLAG